jgi:hypothetical protein
MEIIKDLRKLKKFEKNFNMKFDKTFKYCINQGNYSNISNKIEGYQLKYFSGCFYPYIIKED